MLKAISILGYLGMVGGFLALLALGAIFSSSPFVIAAQAAALFLFLWARITFGWRSFHVAANPTEGGLVTSGPYRYIRHPLYTAMCMFIGTGVAAHWSLGAALCGALILISTGARIWAEEKLVTARYPDYADYASKTWRMIPYVF
jgi:protein-S-isoprenylcysteine O-methyltransferase Ste14